VPSVLRVQLKILEKLTVDFPLGRFIAVTGFSGSGKKVTLINTILKKALSVELIVSKQKNQGNLKKMDWV